MSRAIGGLIGLTTSVTIDDDTRSRTFVQEIRLASNGSGPFRWIIGGFISHLDQTTNELIAAAGAGALFPPAFPSDNLYTGRFNVKAAERALFGEVSYELFPRLTATAGVRVFGNKCRSAR